MLAKKSLGPALQSLTAALDEKKDGADERLICQLPVFLDSLLPQRLNEATKDLCRPVHREALTYVLPDRSKKACLTWRSGIDMCIQETGKAPMWADCCIECKVCFRSENEWEQHYVTKHADETLFQQCLRRIQQWDTKDCTQNEVEAAIELVYGIGQQVGRSNNDIEASILDATKVPGITSHLDDCRRRNPDENREVAHVPKKDATVAQKAQGSKNRPKEPEKMPRLNDLSKKFVERARAGTIYDPSKRDAKKKAEKSAEIVEVDDGEGEYEYYSNTFEEEPPQKKQKKDAGNDASKASSSKETMDIHDWKKRAMELEKIANKLTKESKSLRKQVASLKEKKTKKSKVWKRTVKSLL